MESISTENVIQFYQIYEIESDENLIRQINLNDSNIADVLSFIRRLANDAQNGQSQRQAIFKSDSKVNDLASNCILNNNDLSYLDSIASHLLECEVEYNGEKTSFNIRKGSLLISNFESKGENYLLIAKIDVENFFETQQLKLLKGLPQEKGIYKTCLVKINDNVLEQDVFLSDKNPTISKFWWDKFLCCEFVRDSQKNTEEAFNRLSSTLTYINKVSPVDHAFLKGNLTSYFSTAINFNVDDMLDRVVGGYEPESDKVNTANIKDRLRVTCSSGKFDTSFSIDIRPIKKKLKKTIKIDDDIEIRIKDGDVSKLFHFKHRQSYYVAIKAQMGYGDFRELELEK